MSVFKGLTLLGINGLGELVDAWWDLETAEEDSLLSLDAHVLGPLDEAGQVLGLDDVATNSEVSWVLLEEGLGVTTLGLLDNDLLGNLLDLCQIKVRILSSNTQACQTTAQSVFYSALIWLSLPQRRSTLY